MEISVYVQVISVHPGKMFQLTSKTFPIYSKFRYTQDFWMFLKYCKVQSNTKKLLCLSDTVMRPAQVLPDQVALVLQYLACMKPA